MNTASFVARLCLLIASSALLLYGCGSSSGSVHTGETEVNFTVDTIVVLTREPCFGFCPAYRITLFEDGTIKYHGDSHVKTIGPAWTSVSSAVVNEVRSELWSSNLKLLSPECCDCMEVTDHPYTVIRAMIGSGEMKEIRHYHGCSKAPKWLTTLEDWLDAKLGTVDFIGTEDERRTLDTRSREMR